MNRIQGRNARLALIIICAALLSNLFLPGNVKGADTCSVSASTVSLSSNFSERTARLTSKTLKLNGSRNSDVADTWVVFNLSGNYLLEGLNDAQNDISISADELVSYNGLPAIHITVSIDNGASKGTYLYTITPIERNSGDKLKPLKLRVKIEKKYALAGFQKKMIVLSKTIHGDFALNAPSVSGAVIMPLNSEKYKASIPSGIRVSLDNENTVRVSLGNTAVKSAKGKTKQIKSFKIKLWIGYADYNTFKAVPRTFTVKVASSDPKVCLLKKAGSRIDTIQRASTALHYVPTIQNSGYVLKNVELPDSMQGKYALTTVSDPDSQAITDIYISALSGTDIQNGVKTASLKMTLQEPRQDAETFTKTAQIKFAGSSSKLIIKLAGGKNLSISQSISDNKGVCYKEVFVAGNTFAKIDPRGIQEVKSGKVPSDAVLAEWMVDEYGQAAKVLFTVDKNKLRTGKTYKLQYKVHALGAPANKYTNLVFTLKL